MHAMLISWSLAKCSCPSWSANTDESALRIALASLDDCNSSLHWLLGFFTVWVVVGVALELVFVIWEYVEELHDFRRGIVHPPDMPNRLLFVLGFVAAGLVALGVGGELYAESKISTLETCIRKGNDALFLLLSKEVQQLKTDNLELEAKNLGLQTDLLNLRKESGARRLTGKQREALRKALKGVKTGMAIGWNPEDSEAADFAGDFFSVLTDAHWHPVSRLWAPNQKYGVMIGCIEVECQTSPHIQLLKRGLKKIGISATFITFPVGDKSLSPPS